MKIILLAYTLNDAGLTAIGALGGIIITALINYRTAYLTRKADKERHIRELAVKAAIAQWKVERKRADEWKGSETTKPLVKSLRLQVARFLNFSEILNESVISSETISKNVIESNSVIERAERAIAEAEQHKKA